MAARITRGPKLPAKLTARPRRAAAKLKATVADFGTVWNMRRMSPPPVKEFRFHADRGWRFDYAWPDAMVAVEMEGGTFSTKKKSRHTSAVGHHDDCNKYNEAALAGWCVLRYTAKHMGEAAVPVVEQVARAIHSRLTKTEA